MENRTSGTSLAIFDPEPAYQEIAKSRNLKKEKKGNYLHCPAVTDYFKNTYVIKAPVDITLSFDSEKNWICTEGKSQEFYDLVVINRCGLRESTDAPMMMSLAFQYLFVSDKTCHIETMSPYMHLNNSMVNARIIPGTFDISKWFRSIEPSFEIIDPFKKIEIKRGDPLMYVRFQTEKNEKIVLEHKFVTEEMKKEINKCVDLKFWIPNLKLNDLYEFGKRINKKVFGFKK